MASPTTQQLTREEVLKLNQQLLDGTYPIYKAKPPFMPSTTGFGYQGVVLWDSEADLIQCHLCGRWLKTLASHVHFNHRVPMDTYKEQAGIGRSTTILAFSVREKLSERMKARHDRDPEKWNLNLKKLWAGKRKTWHKNIGRVSEQNRWGTCEAQLKERLKNVAQERGGKTPQLHSLPRGFANTLVKRFGSYHTACLAAGLVPNWRRGVKMTL